MTKKILSILVVILVVALVGGYFGYKHFSTAIPEAENSAGGVNTQDSTVSQQESSPDTPQIQLETTNGNIQAIPNTGQGGLTICMDLCGDGVCQASDPTCTPEKTCTCSENKQECPQDCK